LEITMTAVAGAGRLLAGRYRLDEPLASGGAGQVWRAVDLVLERPVAVKLLRPEAAADPHAHARFRAEARSASRLSHPGVAQVYDYGESGSPGVPFLVMELVDGPSLAHVLAAGPLVPAQAMDVVAQVAHGLHAAHSAGLVHRDIKPANLLIGADGQVKITDFGIASVARSAPLTATGMLVGTPAYLAPERAAGGPATPASDLYSLGVVGYECLTGTPPFGGPPLQVAEAHLREPLPALPATVPAEVAALVAALTDKNPHRRPASAREVAERAARLSTNRNVTPADGSSSGPAPAGPPAAPALTVNDLSAQATQVGLPAFAEQPVARRSHPAWKKAATGLAVAAALAVVGLIGWRAGAHGTATPRPSAQSSAPTVLVTGDTLIGQRARFVLADLQRLGLRPRLQWVPASGRPPGTVVSVQPAGALPLNTIVTVTAAGGEQGHGDGHGGGDGGNGNGNG
jgi:protein kinase-like protein